MATASPRRPGTAGDATEIDLGDVTLLPGLMDMELNLLHRRARRTGEPAAPMHGVQDDPVYRTLRGAVNARTTLDAGFTTVRNLGLMVKTGGYLLDVALAARDRPGLARRAADRACRPRRHALRWAPGPDGVPATGARHHAAERGRGHRQRGARRTRVRRYQIRHGAKVIKVSASGGVMSHSTAPGRPAVLR